MNAKTDAKLTFTTHLQRIPEFEEKMGENNNQEQSDYEHGESIMKEMKRIKTDIHTI